MHRYKKFRPEALAILTVCPAPASRAPSYTRHPWARLKCPSAPDKATDPAALTESRVPWPAQILATASPPAAMVTAAAMARGFPPADSDRNRLSVKDRRSFRPTPEQRRLP